MGSIPEAILVRFGLHFWALRGQQVVRMSLKNDAEINIEKSRASGWPGESGTHRAVAKDGGKGGGNPLP